MKNDWIYTIGLMSGTSLDGLDIVYVKFNKNNIEDFIIEYTATVKYPPKLKSELQNAIKLKDVKPLDREYGQYLGDCVNKFIKNNSIKKIDFIASHGHTIFHQPNKGITLQIGNGQELATITQNLVVCDFRTQDVKLGGQGAPLVPVGDMLLFSEYDACVNLGGFANISFELISERIAFDICPVNIVLNYYTRNIGLEYDDEGNLANRGCVNKTLLKELESLPFYYQDPPKSLGLEWVEENVFPIIDAYQLTINDVLRTFVEHIVLQILHVISGKEKVLFTGGGVYNSFLMNELKERSTSKIIIPNKNLIEYKEALIFALLGLLKIRNQDNCLKSVTGASKNHSSGEIFYPK